MLKYDWTIQIFKSSLHFSLARARSGSLLMMRPGGHHGANRSTPGIEQTTDTTI